MEIAPDLHLVDGARGANVYLIVEDMLTLVDSGLPGNASAIAHYIAWLGRHPEELKHLVLTHSHLDHAGSAAEVRAHTGAEVLAHVAEVQDGLLVPGLAGPGGRVLRGIAGMMRVQPVPVALPLKDGDVLPALGGLRVLHTPGHSPGSICLFAQARGVLFAGDVLMNSGRRLSRPLPWSRRDRALARQSLRKLASLDVELCCFAHGAPLADGVGNAVASFARHPAETPLWRRAIKDLRLLALFAPWLLRRRR